MIPVCQPPRDSSEEASLARGYLEKRPHGDGTRGDSSGLAFDRKGISLLRTGDRFVSRKALVADFRPVVRKAPRSVYGQGDALGYAPLRNAIAEYAGST